LQHGEGPSDGDIVRAVLAGNIEQYGTLVERYRDKYARFAARMLGSFDAAEDAVQDAFIRAYDQLARCRDPDNFLGWFFLILRNRCLAERRRSQLKAEAGEMLEQPGTERADRAVEADEERRALTAALTALTDEQREVFVMKHVEGWSYEEIAKRTGVPVPSLKMRMYRSYQRLRVLLRPVWR